MGAGEDWEGLAHQVGTDNALFFHPNDALRHLRFISRTFSSAPEPPTLATSHPLAAELYRSRAKLQPI